MAELAGKMILVFVLALAALFIQTANASEPNTIEIDVFRYVLAEQQLRIPDGTTLMIVMRGRATVHVIFEGMQEGLADDDDGDLLDEVDTEIVELDLVGLSPMAGPVRMRLWTANRSVGQMEETVNNKSGLLEVPPFGTGTVDSFFDVYFQLDVFGQTFYGLMPARWRSQLTYKPPSPTDVYEELQETQLFDINGNPTSFYIGSGRYRMNPIVEVDVFENPRCELELQIPDGSTIPIPMTGRSVENVFFEGKVEGSAFDDDGNLRDEVQTQMVELDLSGVSPPLGNVNLRLNTDLPSIGVMEERTDHNTGLLDVPPFNDTGSVDSFFDIYFELDIGTLGQTFYNHEPMRCRSVLMHKPADSASVYEILQGVQLYDQDGDLTGFQIIAFRYRPNPVVEIDFFDTSIGSLELTSPGGKTYSFELEGNSTMRVFFEGAAEGTADDNDGDARDEVSTELVQLNLSGSDSDLGAVHLRLDNRRPTLGEIEETGDIETGRLDVPPFSETGSADSFFDVYFELEAFGESFYGSQPMRWRSRINRKPASPGDIYENLEDIKLVDEYGRDTGYILSAARYEPLACGDALHPYPPGDANHDCRVNLLDVAIVGLHWLECTRPDCN